VVLVVNIVVVAYLVRELRRTRRVKEAYRVAANR